MEVGEKVAVGKGGAATSPEQDEQSNEVEAVRVEIYTQVPGVSREDRRQMSPLSGDAVRVWAVIWARPRGSSEAPRPYSSNQRSFPEAAGSLYCIGRGGANGDAPQRARARPDLTGRFRPPNLESLEVQHLPSNEVDPWPAEWPEPQFEWSELDYTTTRTGADDPRAYRYSGTRSLTADASSNDWTVWWPDGTTPGVHRLAVSVTIDDRTIACPANNRERDAGYVTTLLVRDGDVAGPDSAVQEQSSRLLLAPLPALMPEVQGLLRWMSAMLGTPYERGGCWIGGSTLASERDPPLGYQGYGLDCTGLPSAVWTIAGLPTPNSWRFSTHGQHNPMPGSPLYDRFNDWHWTRRGWQRQPGTFDTYGPAILAFAQPGDFFDSGPDSALNHIRIIYEVVSRDIPGGDAQIRIIEASSSEAGRVRIDPESPATLSLRACLSNARNEYGLWRPQPGHPSSNPFP